MQQDNDEGEGAVDQDLNAGPRVVAGGEGLHALVGQFLGYSDRVEIDGFDYGVNYGCNRVRSTSPVPVGSRLRLGVTLASVEDIPNGVQYVQQLRFETAGSDRPACVAEVVGRRYRSANHV